ncbi:MAG: class II aldolase/adducin family protein, partial [Kiritimatiellaceae bacterium]|nr:class II aldolase/adducin family protein [Kiritimatiellaceae bacterium]
RDAAEVRVINDGLICPETTPAKNYGFDVTPARLVTKLICERGVCDATEEGILQLFPEERPDEGYIKFSVHLTEGAPPKQEEVDPLNEVRTELYDLSLIGMLPDGIGYGNVSVRQPGSDSFVVSGTGTGGERILLSEAYCRVDSFDVAANEVWCTGRVQASSESMSHGAVYQANDRIRCVIHIHSRELFEFMQVSDFPKTPSEIAYGTPELAEEIMKLVKSMDAEQGIFVMAGHQDGIIAYGSDIESARETLLGLYQAVFFF